MAVSGIFSPGYGYISLTKTHGFSQGNVAIKWKRKYRGWTAEEAWLILTNLPEFGAALRAYEKRMGIEEMFRDLKSGGYNLEDTQVTGRRLIALTLLMTLADASDTLAGQILRQKGVNSYVNRPSETGRKYPRHSHFYTGNRGQAWLQSLEQFPLETRQFLQLCPQKRVNYLRGYEAANVVRRAF